MLDAVAGDVFSSAVIGGFVAALGFGATIAQSAGAPLPMLKTTGLDLESLIKRGVDGAVRKAGATTLDGRDLS